MAKTARGPDLSNRPPSGTLRALVSQPEQLLVELISADLAARGFPPFLDLGPERVGHPVPIGELSNRATLITSQT